MKEYKKMETESGFTRLSSQEEVKAIGFIVVIPQIEKIIRLRKLVAQFRLEAWNSRCFWGDYEKEKSGIDGYTIDYFG